ncbi:hypothetical protein BRADI_5g03015v3 [Brachypodium distachyon]|uniref:Transmembrane protein n=1 Tax=Brachypodium distachyon TaxID=15368 RepID=A0A2K2CF47_BRADI|nr:hypothetical protein BRADI_5g03015v3 [Brachypodium distachyon]
MILRTLWDGVSRAYKRGVTGLAVCHCPSSVCTFSSSVQPTLLCLWCMAFQVGGGAGPADLNAVEGAPIPGYPWPSQVRETMVRYARSLQEAIAMQTRFQMDAQAPHATVLRVSRMGRGFWMPIFVFGGFIWLWCPFCGQLCPFCVIFYITSRNVHAFAREQQNKMIHSKIFLTLMTTKRPFMKCFFRR